MERNTIYRKAFTLISILLFGLSAYSQFSITSVTEDDLSCRVGYGQIAIYTQNRTGNVFFGLYDQPPFPPPSGLITYATYTLDEDSCAFNEAAAGTYYVVAVDLSSAEVRGRWITLSSVQTQVLTADAIVVISGPTCSFSNDAVLQASASGGNPPYTYTWNPGGVSGQQYTTAGAPGIYSVTVTDSYNCDTSSASNNVEAFPYPTTHPSVPDPLDGGTITASDPSVCQSQDPDIINNTVSPSGESGVYSYDWEWSLTGSAPWTSLGVNNLTYNPPVLAQTTYYRRVTVDASCGIAYSNIISVIVNSLPNPVAGSNSPVCVGESLDLTGAPAGMTTYSWSGPDGFSSSQQSPNVSPSATLAMAGVYTLTVIDGNGCSNSANTTVVVNGLPAVSASNNGPICEGESLDLTGGPGGMTSYSWSGPNGFSSNQQSPNVSPAATPAMSGVYTLTVVDGNGCSNAANTTAVVNALPAATASSNSPVCVGESLDLTGGPGGMASYSWSGPNGFSSNQQSPNVSPAATPAMAGVYTLTVVDGNGCSNVANTTVVVNNLPNPTAANNGPVCEGESLDLTGGPGGMTSYSWSGPNGFSSNQQSPNVSPAATPAMAGVYTLTVIDGNGCSNAANTTVVVNSLPAASASNNGPVCEGESLDLTGGPAGMTSYSWTGPNGFSSNQQSPNVSPAATPAMAGIYTLTVVDGNGCSNAANTTVVVNSLPAVTASSNSPVCVGESLDLTGGPSGMTSYSWSGPNGFSSNQQSPNVSPSATPAMAGVYTLTVIDGNGCSNAANTTVVVNSLPAVTAASNSPVCEGESLDLTGGPAGMTSYSWSGPNGFSSNQQSPNVSPSATPAMAGVYTLTVVDGNGCSNAANTTVVVNSLPAASASNNGPVCEGESLDLTGGPAGMTSYSWTGPNGFSSNQQSPNVSPAATPAMAGIYTLTVVDGNGCSNAANTTVVVNSLPAVTAASNSPVCIGESLDLTGGPAGMTSYSWSGPNGFSSTQQSPNVSPSATLAMAGVYTLTVIDGNGCSNAANTTVVVNSLPAVTAASNSPVCEGESLDLTGGPAGMTSYSWSGPNGFSSNQQSPNVSPSATLTMAGVYTLTVIDGNGCSNAANTTVVVNSLPAVSAASNSPVCEGESLDLTGGPAGMSSYSWSGPNGFTSNQQSPNVSPAATPAMAGVYTLTVVDGNGCSNAANTTIVVNSLPTATASSNSPVCVGEPLNLTGGPAGMSSYSWTGPNGFSSSQQSPNVSPSATLAMAGIYNLTVVDGNGCSNSANTTVVVNDNPLVSIIPDPGSTCTNQDLLIISVVSGGTAPYDTYAWTGSGAAYLDATDVPATNFNSPFSGSYGLTLTVTDDAGCSGVGTSTINVIDEPTAYAGPDTTLCNGDSYQILDADTTNSDGIQWVSLGDGNFDFNNVIDPVYTPGPNDIANGSVQIVLRASGIGSCGNATDTAVITIAEPVQPLIGAPAPFVIGPNTEIEVCMSTSGHQFIEDLGFYLRSPDGQYFTLKKGILETNFFFPPCFNFFGGGDVDNLCFTTELTLADTLDLCTEALPVSGTFAATGDWSMLYGMNPAEGGWSIAINDTADFGTGGTDGVISAASITFVDTSATTGLLTSVDYSSGVIAEPIRDDRMNTIIIPRDLQVSCPGECDANALVTTTGGVPPYLTYIWSPSPVGGNGTDNVILCAGDYDLTVIDAIGCSGTTSVTVLEPPSINIDNINYTDTLACNGASDGFISVHASGGTGSLRFTLLPDIPSETADSGYFSGLSIGTYTVRIEDAKACYLDTILTIYQPAPLVLESAMVTDSVFCAGDNNGRIVATASGGTQPYTFILEPDDISNSTGEFTMLPPGSYVVRLTDANDCDTLNSDTLILGVPVPLVIDTVMIDSIVCNGDDALLTVVVSGGTPPYDVLVNGVPEVLGIADTAYITRGAGNYDISVSDGRMCTDAWANINLVDPPPLTLTNLVLTPVTGCYTNPNGEILVNVAGGVPPYEYSLDGTSYQSSNLLTGLMGGYYTVYYRDDLGCVHTKDTVMTSPPILLGNPVVTHVEGDNLGSIELFPSGGTPFPAPDEYLISFDGGPLGTQTLFEDLTPGSYDIHIEDAQACPWDTTIIIVVIDLDVTLVAYDADCYGEPSGEIRIWMNDGTPPYDIYLDSELIYDDVPENFRTIPNVYPGTYDIRVEDFTTRRFDTTVTIGSPPPFNIEKQRTNVSCHEYNLDGSIPNNGAISYESTGGSGSFTYTWEDTEDSDSTRENLTRGTYIVTISDANACTLIDTTYIVGIDTLGAGITIYPVDPFGVMSTEELFEYPSGEDDTLCYLSNWTLIAAYNSLVATDLEWSADTLLDDPNDYDAVTPTTTIYSPKHFRLEVTNDRCMDYDSIHLYMHDTIGMVILTDAYQVGDSIYSPQGRPLNLSGPDGYVEYLWSAIDPFDNDEAQNTVITPEQNQLIELFATTTEGCYEADTIYIVFQRRIETIYDVFTPNDDGYNDLWIIPNALQYPDLEVFIFNRWGQQVFYSKPYGIDTYHTFDGTNQKNGKPLPVGSYYFIINPNDGEQETLTGTVTIVR